MKKTAKKRISIAFFPQIRSLKSKSFIEAQIKTERFMWKVPRDAAGTCSLGKMFYKH